MVSRQKRSMLLGGMEKSGNGMARFGNSMPVRLISFLPEYVVRETIVVFACGQNGTLIVGRHATWNFVDLEDFSRDFWDAHWYGDKLYLATMQTLYTFTDSGLAEVDFGDDSPSTCYRLSSAEGVLWSVGSDDVFSFDGKQWTRVD